MIFVGGSDKIIIACVHQIPHILYLTGNAVNILLRSYSLFSRAVFDFLTMFIGSGTEKHVISHRSFISCYAVRHYNFIGIAEMRLT